jgi:virulence factor
MSEKVRVAVIGAGMMANMVHYPSLSSFEDVELAGICDLSTTALHNTADKYGIINRYTNYREMIEEVKPDAVYAIGPPHIMYDIWKWCLEQGQNLYVEKPLGVTLHQAQAMAYLADKNNCITQVSFQRRNSSLANLLREECLKRGPITHAVCKFYKSDIRPYLEARDRMLDDGVHSIDTLRWMCGGEVVRIDSAVKRIQVPDINFFSATLHFDNGATGFMINSWSSGRRIFSVEMHAPGICAEAELEKKGIIYADNIKNGIEYDVREVAGGEELYKYGGFLAKNREFIDAVKSGRKPSSHFGDAVKTMEVAEKILAQAILEGK